jgi:hypothetical protein
VDREALTTPATAGLIGRQEELRACADYVDALADRVTGTRRALSVTPNAGGQKFGFASGNRASLGSC